MRRRFPRLSAKLALVVGGVVALLGLGLTAVPPPPHPLSANAKARATPSLTGD